MPYKSNRAAVEALMAQATDAGLKAAADVALTAVKEGYHAPQFFTGWSASHGGDKGKMIESAQMDEPHNERGERTIRIGTNYFVARFYELGFHQRTWVWFSAKLGRFFSKEGPTRFVRHEVWRPAFERTTAQQGEAFAQAYQQTMESQRAA